MRKNIRKSLATVACTLAVIFTLTMGISADNTEFKLVKVVGDGYKITSSKSNEEVLQNTYKYQDLFLNSTEGEWASVTTADGQITGYIMASALEENIEETKTSNSKKTEISGTEVVALAKTKLGSPYSYGSSGPNAFDCSGFTTYVYRQFGVSLPRTSSAQASVGKAVSYSEAMPGDLIAYSGHVAIYVGDGMMIHSPRPGQAVSIASVSSVGSVRSVRRLV